MKVEKVNNQRQYTVPTQEQIKQKDTQSTHQYGLAGNYVNATTRHLVPDYKAPDIPSFTPSKVGGGFSYQAPSAQSSYTPQMLSRIGAFSPSSAYNQAMEYTNGLLAKLSSGRTSYSDKVDAMMAQIEGRDKFRYDPDTDPLFQNALNSSMESGKKAMSDTMGQAAALTGGYGSSYATAAANGAYNSFVQDAYDNLPEYYEAALNQYNMETQDLYNKLGMYSTADEMEYNRLSNAYSLNYGAAQDMYNHEYANYWDTANYNYNVDSYNANMAYQSYRDDQNYNLNVMQMNNDNAYRYASLAQSQAQHNDDMAYKYATMAQDAREYEQSRLQDALKNSKSELDYDTAIKRMSPFAENGRLDSDEFWNTLAYYGNQGYDTDYLYNLMVGNTKQVSTMPSTPVFKAGKYYDESGKEIPGLTSTWKKVSKGTDSKDAMYEDEYGNQITESAFKSYKLKKK